MSLYLTADTHFGHANIIRFCDRPYLDVEAMDAALVDNWNDTVRPNDEVWHLGDVAMGLLEITLQQVRRLHGRKYLVAGNHDRCWSHLSPQRRAGWDTFYTDIGFTLLPEQTTLLVSGRQVNVSHFPYRGDSGDNDRHANARPDDDGRWLLHGHVHTRWQQRDQMINVGVDVWDYRPVHLTALEALITATPPAVIT